MDKKIDIGQFTVEADKTFFFIAGPCVIEDEATTLEVARFVKELSDKLSIPAIFKTSYDKANRTSLESFRGPGLKRGLESSAKSKKGRGFRYFQISMASMRLTRRLKCLMSFRSRHFCAGRRI